MPYKRKLENLPSSDDKDFWSEGEVNLIDSKRLKAVDMSQHQYIQRGQEIVCIGCSFNHSVPFPQKFEVKEGKLYAKN